MSAQRLACSVHGCTSIKDIIKEQCIPAHFISNALVDAETPGQRSIFFFPSVHVLEWLTVVRGRRFYNHIFKYWYSR